ncbi:hypothetical protein EVAR_31212_1 [Eumeta japonica]|uniref:Uncharacterized protein n=1 Tax=Eumeta variegata TaxID=151549 RepID=A0A4C1VVY3_EUMVA|nr:hypothetical protein EVAR_31212_1 [Eumeta japonica]
MPGAPSGAACVALITQASHSHLHNAIAPAATLFASPDHPACPSAAEIRRGRRTEFHAGETVGGKLVLYYKLNFFKDRQSTTEPPGEARFSVGTRRCRSICYASRWQKTKTLWEDMPQQWDD